MQLVMLMIRSGVLHTISIMQRQLGDRINGRGVRGENLVGDGSYPS